MYPAEWYGTAKAEQGFPLFAERQLHGADHVYQLLAPHVRSGAVTAIVDFGCGQGEILRHLATRFSAHASATILPLIGFDSDPLQVSHAIAQPVRDLSGISLEFRCCSDRVPPLRGLRQAIERFKPSGTQDTGDVAVLCLGHTVFHLTYLPRLLGLLAKRVEHLPALLILDSYTSWDAVLDEVANREVLEPRYFWKDDAGREGVRALFTRRARPGFVIRGLRDLSFATGQGEPVLETEQLAWPSAKLSSAFESLGYTQCDRAPAVSGWGEMERRTFLRPQRTGSFGGLFLDCKVDPQPLQSSDATPQHAAMGALAKWIDTAGLIPASGGGFDFVAVEVAPWYNALAGLTALSQDVIVCGRRERFDADAAAQILAGYTNGLRRIQLAGLGSYLHPHFYGSPNSANVQFSVLPGSSSEAEARLLAHSDDDAWLAPANEETRREVLALAPHLTGVLETTPIKGLLHHGMNDVRERLQAKYGRNLRFNNPDDATRTILRKDLEKMHLLLHDVLRSAFGVGDDVTTALFGVPLASALDKQLDAKTGLPERYRGGVWVFAGTSAGYGPIESKQILDLTRLAALLQSSAIDAQASKALTALITTREIRARRRPLFRTASDEWNRSRVYVVRDEKIFEEGQTPPRHSPGRWLQMDPAQRKPWEPLIVRLAQEALERCTGRQIELDFEDAIVFLKGMTRRPLGYLSARMAARLLDVGDGEISNDLNLREMMNLATSNEVNGGELARALHQFCSSEPNEGRTVRKGIASCYRHGRRTFHLYFDTNFDSSRARDDAKFALQQNPFEGAEADDDGYSPGEAREARYWLSLATEVRGGSAGNVVKAAEDWKIAERGKLGLRIEFWFPAG